MLQIAVMGPLAVTRDGEPVGVPGGRTAQLLVRLALDAGRAVSADRLVEDLWGEAAVTTRPNTLQSKVARLRRALGDPGAVVGADGAYRLAVDPAAVDALAVLRDADAAARLAAAGDDPGAAALCAAGLARYAGGSLLPAAGDGDWVVAHRTRLAAARTRLVETGAAARLRLDDAGGVVAMLEAAVADDPYQERLWELLMAALYRVDRQADALGAYGRIHARLRDELGLAPGPALRALQQRILQQDPALDAAPARAATGNLPSLAVGLVGREAEVAGLVEAVGRARLVELVGPGGVGKTAVAIAAGRRLGTRPGGVWLVRLEGATTDDDVRDTLLEALAVAGGEAALHERLRSAAAVLILDNCEHVLDAVAAQVVRLLDAAPALRILCTSQVALGVDGGTVVELEPLALVDAIELFARRATTRPGDRSAGAERDAVQELCRALDGLPLAIELAAARTRTLSVDEINRRLDDRFSVLRDPASRRPERRRALKAAIGWSYELLFPDDQRGLWALATFADGATIAAVESVLAALDVPAAAAIDVVGRLASRSLVIVDSDGAGVRYRLLDSIRAFALEAMGDAGMTGRSRAAHAAWYAAAAAGSTAGVRGVDQAVHLAFARSERANIDAALGWCTVHDTAMALDLVNGFGWAWIVLGDSRGIQRIRAALDGARDAPARDRAGALLLLAWLEASTDQLAQAREHVAAADALARAGGDRELEARGCYHLAYVVSHVGEFARALELTDRAAALYAGLDRPWDRAANGLFAARAAISSRDVARATAAVDDVNRELETVADPWLHARRDATLGELARIEHRFADAVAHLERASRASTQRGFLQTAAYQTFSLARARCQAGDYERGTATLRQAIEQAEATGDPRLATLGRVHLGRVLRAAGDDAGARAALEVAAAWHDGAGGGEQAALGDCLLAAMDAAAGDAAAPARLLAILERARRAADAPVEVFALDALARVAAAAGDEAGALARCVEADARMVVASDLISDRDRIDAAAVRRSPGVRAG